MTAADQSILYCMIPLHCKDRSKITRNIIKIKETHLNEIVARLWEAGVDITKVLGEAVKEMGLSINTMTQLTQFGATMQHKLLCIWAINRLGEYVRNLSITENNEMMEMQRRIDLANNSYLTNVMKFRLAQTETKILLYKITNQPT